MRFFLRPRGRHRRAVLHPLWAAFFLTLLVAASFNSAQAAPAAPKPSAPVKRGAPAAAAAPRGAPAGQKPAGQKSTGQLRTVPKKVVAPAKAPVPAGAMSLSIPKADMRPANNNELEVLGQVRNLNMMLILKNKSDKISGIEMRKEYRREITTTNF